MYIDLHTHTRAYKNGELKTRNMPLERKALEFFIEQRRQKNIGVVAITNHNNFDSEQFEELLKIKGNILLLAGAEIDVRELDEQSNVHHNCNFIVAPEKRDELSRFLEESGLTRNSPISLKSMLKKAKELNAILLIDCNQKGRNFPSTDYGFIQKFCEKNNIFWALETSNRKSSQLVETSKELGYKLRSLLGTDSHCWDKINENKLTKINDMDVRKENFSSYTQFLSFLSSTRVYDFEVKRIKSMEKELKIKPKTWGAHEGFSYKPDLGGTLIVGARGLGKTAVLEAINEELKKEVSAKVIHYKNDYTKTNEFKLYDEKEEKIKTKLKQGMFDLKDEFNNLLTHITQANENPKSEIFNNFKSYLDWWKVTTSKYEKLRVFSGPFNKSNSFDTDFREKREVFKKNSRTIESVLDIINAFGDRLSEGLKLEVKNSMNSLSQELKALFEKDIKSISKDKIGSSILYQLKSDISDKTDGKKPPESLGIAHHIRTRKNLRNSISELLKKRESHSEYFPLGETANEAGTKKLYLSACYSSVTHKMKSDQWGDEFKSGFKQKIKGLCKVLKEIERNWIKIEETYIKITKAKEMIDDGISGDKFSLIKYRYTEGNEHKEHMPSPGEKNFINLSEILTNENYDYYLLDEPEKSLDNETVNQYIVKRLQKLKDNKKYIILITHNANLAVHLNPTTKIYRCVNSNDEKMSYISIEGNPNMYLNGDKSNTNAKEWDEVAPRLLEGGADAFRKRGEYYGIRPWQ